MYGPILEKKLSTTEIFSFLKKSHYFKWCAFFVLTIRWLVDFIFVWIKKTTDWSNIKKHNMNKYCIRFYERFSNRISFAFLKVVLNENQLKLTLQKFFNRRLTNLFYFNFQLSTFFGAFFNYLIKNRENYATGSWDLVYI